VDGCPSGQSDWVAVGVCAGAVGKTLGTAPQPAPESEKINTHKIAPINFRGIRILFRIGREFYFNWASDQLPIDDKMKRWKFKQPSQKWTAILLLKKATK
jgi:hypothetical protein